MSAVESDAVSGALKSAILKAAARMLEPVVRLTLEGGVGLAEFNQVVRQAYVRAAAQPSPEGKPNYSRISMLTGVSRATAAAILARVDGPSASASAAR